LRGRPNIETDQPIRMNDQVKNKLKAAGKVAFGAARIVSGTATATGHGLLGAYCKKHHMLHAAVRYGTESAKAGMKTIEEGLSDWKRA
jgi:hypothetical protein